jgi:hypothetical protein
MEGEKPVLINFDFASHGSSIPLSFGGQSNFPPAAFFVFLNSDSNTTGKIAFANVSALIDRLVV